MALMQKLFLFFVGLIFLFSACSPNLASSDVIEVDPDLVPAELKPQEPTTTITTLPVEVATFSSSLYYVFEDQEGVGFGFFPCEFSIAVGESLEESLRNLLKKLVEKIPDEHQECLIPLSTATLVGLEVEKIFLKPTADGYIVILDYEEGSLGRLEASLQRKAIGQIVFTLTGMPGIEGVIFKVGGEDVSVSLENGSSEMGEVITRGDFPKANAFLVNLVNFFSQESEPKNDESR